MVGDAEIVLNEEELDALIRELVKSECVPRIARVADACNDALDEEWKGGYMVSAEGERPLKKRDYRATCITANWGAIVDNAANNRLVQNFYLAGAD